jgi:acetoin utilization protein AcuB
MVARDLIDNNIPTLNSDDSVERAIQIMNDLKINQLPFVVNNHFEGLFSEDLLLNFDFDIELAQIPVIKEEIRLTAYTPILEIIKNFENTQAEILPVVDDQENYGGVVEKKHVF